MEVPTGISQRLETLAMQPFAVYKAPMQIRPFVSYWVTRHRRKNDPNLALRIE